MEDQALNSHHAHQVIEIFPLVIDSTVSMKSLPEESFPVCKKLESFQDSLKAHKPHQDPWETQNNRGINPLFHHEKKPPTSRRHLDTGT